MDYDTWFDIYGDDWIEAAKNTTPKITEVDMANYMWLKFMDYIQDVEEIQREATLDELLIGS